VTGLRRVLIANRGEIAVRILRACVDEGLEAVAAVSEADRRSLAALLADRVVCIGPAPAAESYLDVERVVAAAQVTGCDALHPGYGFLSERPELPEACAAAGITFVGPSAEAMRRAGDKAAARATARRLGIPVGEGSGVLDGVEDAQRAAREAGFPVLLKAAAGGGGRGMRRVDAPGELPGAFAAAAAEARQAFGDDRLFCERFVRRARHVEVQVLADAHGQVVHLGHRDCTLQRRFQKLVEEAPAAGLPDVVSRGILEAAVTLIGALDYVGAATCEFLVDVERGTFSFLEINARLQVEHPVSEEVTGIDVVRRQLRIAGGAPLGVRHTGAAVCGHALEVRINAEAPERDFAPGPGTLRTWAAPVGSAVRVETAAYPGWRVPPFYDSLLAKIVTRGATRAEALGRMRHALAHLRVEGVPTTAAFAAGLLAHPDVQAGAVHTRWVEETFLPAWRPEAVPA
jgi:acetyl-CoA carboxylase biotin carboxylase subunit